MALEEAATVAAPEADSILKTAAPALESGASGINIPSMPNMQGPVGSNNCRIVTNYDLQSILDEIESGIISKIGNRVLETSALGLSAYKGIYGPSIAPNVVSEIFVKNIMEIFEQKEMNEKLDVNTRIGNLILDNFKKSFNSIQNTPFLFTTMMCEEKNKIILNAILQSIFSSNTNNNNNSKDFINRVKKTLKNPLSLNIVNNRTIRQNGGKKYTRRKKVNKKLYRKTGKRRINGGSTEPQTKDVSVDTKPHIEPNVRYSTKLPIDPLIMQNVRDGIETAKSIVSTPPPIANNNDNNPVTMAPITNNNPNDPLNTYIIELVKGLNYRIETTQDQFMARMIASINNSMKDGESVIIDGISKSLSKSLSDGFLQKLPNDTMVIFMCSLIQKLEYKLYDAIRKVCGQKSIDSIIQSPDFTPDVCNQFIENVRQMNTPKISCPM